MLTSWGECSGSLADQREQGHNGVRRSLTNDKKNKLEGKIVKFIASVKNAVEKGIEHSPLTEDVEILIHHYICTERAYENITSIYDKHKDKLDIGFAGNITFSYGLLLKNDIAMGPESSNEFAKLCKKYYNDAIEGDGVHGGKSGTTEKTFGYAQCGLPVVLEHNTPNNSLPLIWAETHTPDDKHDMKPLFRRRERHSDMDNQSDGESND